jgi:hypothetical protein
VRKATRGSPWQGAEHALDPYGQAEDVLSDAAVDDAERCSEVDGADDLDLTAADT